MLIIGISGGSGSGKTTFINEIRSHFDNEDITLISQDEYYHPRETQKPDLNGVLNFDLPSSIDMHQFSESIKALMRGETVEKEEYTFNNELKEPKKLVFKPAKILIVEGLFIFHDKSIYDLLDLRVMIHASSALKVIRRIQRDRIERNYPLEDVLYRYEHHVLPSYKAYIEPYLDKVDLVINNNNNYKMALDMLLGYLENKIKKERASK